MLKGILTLKVMDTEIKQLNQDGLAAIYQAMVNNEDEKNSLKIVDLYDKRKEDKLIISFSGHFSAGKSSIINYLIGRNILPNSPIPTSANIVKISSGEGVARVFFKDETPVEYNEPYDIDMIKDYCMNKDTISRLEISTADNVLPENTYILDTPGIDAADDADRLMTESSLHLVDVLYYVMDYNHVQSEVNLYFLKKIQAQGIPIHIIINQIDKHNEQEISFDAFDKAVKQTFDQWKINVTNIYYTSALVEDGAHNQIKALKRDLFTLLANKQTNKERIVHATEQIIDDHVETLVEGTETNLIDYVESKMETFDIHTYQALEDKLSTLSQVQDNINQAFTDELTVTLKNAYLMPAVLRDKAAGFLASQQKDFKVGFFKSKKKTAIERDRILSDFLTALEETINATITWKLREKFVEILQSYNITDETVLNKAQQLHIAYGKDKVLAFMKQGATINGNYILHYTNELSADIKAQFRQVSNALWRDIELVVNASTEKERTKVEAALAQFENVTEYQQMKEEVEQTLTRRLDILKAQIAAPTTNETVRAAIENQITEQNKVVKETLPLTVQDDVEVENVSEKEVNETEIVPSHHHTVDNMTDIIDKAMSTLSSMSVFDSIIADLEVKQDRLKNRELTIALFGAFSAGKSSFSNALFGEFILPVSPNPTTAVVSRISKVTEEHPHGTVVITCKEEATLVADLQMITKDLSPVGESFAELMDWIKRGHIQYSPSLNNMYQAYLNAMLQGFDTHKDLLGKTIEISMEAFESYVTDESIACYIETVDLYYDCLLTQKGITLVDTPGADSVNARHTNVAFDYIKSADAILYVTYYNHAITSADRDFLMQLGRVKEAFELDKMFFIVNASDLAQTPKDLSLVLDYVEEQLLQFGIRHPKIYPVSSKQSLEEKTTSTTLNQEMKTFEQAFYSFIDEDLAALTIESALWDIARAKGMLGGFIETANVSEADQQTYSKEINDKRDRFLKLIHSYNDTIAMDRINERITRQLHYVLERQFIRFHEMFTQFFNPTTLTATGKKGQAELKLSTNQFIDYIGYELLQEVRAVSLRIESLMKDSAREMYNQIQFDIKQMDEHFIIPSVDELHFVTPNLEQAYTLLDDRTFTRALKQYKNPKTFFEQNEREKMKDAFMTSLNRKQPCF